MGPIDATLRCLARPFTWSGRAAPSEYWWFTLVYMLLSMSATIGALWPLIVMLKESYDGTPLPPNFVAIVEERQIVANWAGVLFIWPAFCHLAVMVRRLHDTDRSGWWYWIALVPFVGWLVLLILLILPGDATRNDYGKPPGGGSGYAPGEVGRPKHVAPTDLPPLDPSLRAPIAMGPLKAVLTCVLSPFTWRGRSGPGEYWWFTLFTVVVSSVASTILLWPVFDVLNAWDAAVAVERQRAYDTITAVQPIPFPDLEPAFLKNWIGWAVYGAVSIPLSLSWIAVTVRRLHDTEHSGGWYWIQLVPIVGPIFLIVLLAAPGQIHRNRYGPGRGVSETPVRGSDMPVVPRDPLAGVNSPEALRALRQSRMQG